MNLKSVSLEIDYLLTLIASFLHRKETPIPPENLNWAFFVRLTQRQKVDNIVCYALESVWDSVPEKAALFFREAKKKALFLCAIRQNELRQLFLKFDEAQIRYIPLKGYFLKKLYPSEDMRTMVDTDILVDKKSLKIGKKILLSLGYRIEHENTECIHIVYVKPPVMSLELHYRLLLSVADFYSEWEKGLWNNAVRICESSWEFQMEPDDFYIYLMEHLIIHYKTGGIEVRFLVDIWFFRQRFQAELDRDKLASFFEKKGHWKFVESIEKLVQIWFDDVPSSELYDNLTQFIFQGQSCEDVMGTRLLESAAGQEITIRSKIRYLFPLIFPSIKALSGTHPMLKKCFLLYPFFWFGYLTGHLTKTHSRKMVKALFSLKKDKINQLDEFHKKTGLRK